MRSSLRRVGFWFHLVVGALAGTVILVMSVTGAALAFKPQITRWAERDARTVIASGPALPASQLIAAVQAAYPDLPVRGVTLDHDPTTAAMVQAGPHTFYVDPYSGTLRGESSARLQQTFRWLEDWHRWLAMTGDGRTTGRLFTGTANAGFLVLALTGLYLWWPRAWTRAHLRPILLLRPGATGRARDFNWHHVAGFWLLPMMVVMSLTGVFMSYPSLYSIVPGMAVAAGGPRGESGPRREGRPGPRAAETATAVAVQPEVIDAAVAAALDRQGAWATLALSLPRQEGAPVTVTLSESTAVGAGRAQLSVAAESGAIVGWQPAVQAPAGAQRIRFWVRFGHTGELWGLPGQMLAFIGCVAGLLLVVTGWSLAIRRFAAWLRRPSRTAHAVRAA